MSTGRVRWAPVARFSIVAHAHQFPDEDEDKAMRVICYLICALSIAIFVGVLLYTTLL